MEKNNVSVCATIVLAQKVAWELDVRAAEAFFHDMNFMTRVFTVTFSFTEASGGGGRNSLASAISFSLSVRKEADETELGMTKKTMGAMSRVGMASIKTATKNGSVSEPKAGRTGCAYRGVASS